MPIIETITINVDTSGKVSDKKPFFGYVDENGVRRVKFTLPAGVSGTAKLKYTINGVKCEPIQLEPDNGLTIPDRMVQLTGNHSAQIVVKQGDVDVFKSEIFTYTVLPSIQSGCESRPPGGGGTGSGGCSCFDHNGKGYMSFRANQDSVADGDFSFAAVRAAVYSWGGIGIGNNVVVGDPANPNIGALSIAGPLNTTNKGYGSFFFVNDGFNDADFVFGHGSQIKSRKTGARSTLSGIDIENGLDEGTDEGSDSVITGAMRVKNLGSRVRISGTDIENGAKGSNGDISGEQIYNNSSRPNIQNSLNVRVEDGDLISIESAANILVKKGNRLKISGLNHKVMGGDSGTLEGMNSYIANLRSSHYSGDGNIVGRDLTGGYNTYTRDSSDSKSLIFGTEISSPNFDVGDCFALNGGDVDNPYIIMSIAADSTTKNVIGITVDRDLPSDMSWVDFALIVNHKDDTDNAYNYHSGSDIISTSARCNVRGQQHIIAGGYGNTVDGSNHRLFYCDNCNVSGEGHVLTNASGVKYSGKFSEFVQGAIEVIGNGTDENNRSNAYIIYANGTVWTPSD